MHNQHLHIKKVFFLYLLVSNIAAGPGHFENIPDGNFVDKRAVNEQE